MTMKHLEGKITISRYQGGMGEGISIAVTDNKSHVTLIKVDMTIANYGEVVSGLSFIPCTMQWNDSKLIGHTREHKKEAVPNLDRYDNREDTEAVKEHLAPWTIDGWVARVDDLFNHHNQFSQDGKRMCNVVFERWVDDNGNPVS